MRQFTHIIANPMGIHARPAAMLVEAARGLSSQVSVTKDGKTSPATRLVSLMLLEVCQGDSVTVTVEGPEEEEDARFLAEFFQSNL